MSIEDKGFSSRNAGETGAATAQERRHTPGPWRISRFEGMSGSANRMIMGADDYSVAYVSGRTEAEHDADARLIAAAPDMFEALRMIDAFWNGRVAELGELSDEAAEAHARAKAAIAKAQGQV